MNEGSGLKAYDVSGFRKDGTFSNGPTWASGQYGHVIRFDGSDDFVSCGNYADINALTDNFSVCFSILPTATAQTTKGIITHLSGSDTGWVIAFGSVGQLRFPFYSEGASGDITLINGTWYRVVAQQVAGVNILWVNGTVETSTGSRAIPSVSEPLLFGRIYSSFTGFNASMLLDDVRIYNRVLTPAEIASDYNNPFLEFRQSSRRVFAALAPAAGYLPRSVIVSQAVQRAANW